MKKIALLRGINVGGHKKFPKAEQLAMAKTLGFSEIEIYLHTGNWIFNSEKNAGEISEMIQATILKKHGWEVPVLVFTAEEIRTIYDNCPFSEEIKEKSYFIFLSEKPNKALVDEIEPSLYPGEIFQVTPQCIYIYYKNGAGRAKLTTNWFENKLKVTATARNYNTMKKLVFLATS